MRKSFIYSLIALPLILSCGGGTVNPIPYVEPEKETREDTVNLGLSEVKEYTPLKDATFEVSVLDTSIVTYDTNTKSFTSYQTEGVTTANFTNDEVIYVVTVTVRDDGTAPIFKLDEPYVNLKTEKTYTVNTSLTYRGKDVFSLTDGLKYTLESEYTPVSTLKITNNVIEITSSKALGEDKYTIYVNYLNHLLSNTLTVKVIEDNAFVIVGSILEYDSDGPLYNVSMYNYTSNKINLRNDLVFSKSGNVVNYDSVTITATDSTIAEISSNDELIIHKTGTSYLHVKYNNDEIDIKVTIYKPVIDEINQTLADNKFALNLECKTEGNKRVYTGNNSVTKTFSIDTSSHTFTGAKSIETNGIVRESTAEHTITYNSGNVTIPASLFDIDCYGELGCKLLMEANEYYVQYNFNMFFITKALITVQDFNTYIPMKFPNETVVGYYTLGADIDFNGYNPGAIYVSGADKETYGFRGTIDGTKTVDSSGKVTETYAIKNMKSSPYGLSICLGKGCIIKNVAFTGTIFDNKTGASLFGRFMFGVTLVNVDVNFNSSQSDLTNRPPVTDPTKPGDPNGTGIFSSQKVENCSFVDVIIDAYNTTVRCLCGKSGTNNTFTECFIYAEKLNYYSTGTQFDSETFEPTGGVRYNDDIPGLTVCKK